MISFEILFASADPIKIWWIFYEFRGNVYGHLNLQWIRNFVIRVQIETFYLRINVGNEIYNICRRIICNIPF